MPDPSLVVYLRAPPRTEDTEKWLGKVLCSCLGGPKSNVCREPSTRHVKIAVKIWCIYYKESADNAKKKNSRNAGNLLVAKPLIQVN